MSKNNQNELAELNRMLEDLKAIKKIYQPSEFWQELNSTHINHLTVTGFKNFKRSISGKYFSWGMMGLLAHQLFPMLLTLSRNNISLVKNVGFKDYSTRIGSRVRRFDPFSAMVYKVYLGLLYDFVSKVDKLGLLKKLEEPSVGNPFIINHSKRSLSQDLLNSIYEFYSITDKINFSKVKEIAELGAGYGRLAFVFLKVLPKAKYTIIDIPPALYISQRYLKNVFPKEKIFTYRRFKDFKSVRKEFENARIRFVMADQIEMIPNKYFDLTISVSTLHEMTRPQITKFISEINRITKGYFYTKQWRRSRTSVNDFITTKEYPIPSGWKLLYRRERHPIQRWFFDALYLISDRKTKTSD